MELEIICLGQFLHNCKCEIDRDPNHKPNNLDCPKYIPVTVRYFNAVAVGEIKANEKYRR
jgi:hypothetical protein